MKGIFKTSKQFSRQLFFQPGIKGLAQSEGSKAYRIKLLSRVVLKLVLFFLGLYLTSKFALLVTGIFFNK